MSYYLSLLSHSGYMAKAVLITQGSASALLCLHSSVKRAGEVGCSLGQKDWPSVRAEKQRQII